MTNSNYHVNCLRTRMHSLIVIGILISLTHVFPMFIISRRRALLLTAACITISAYSACIWLFTERLGGMAPFLLGLVFWSLFVSFDSIPHMSQTYESIKHFKGLHKAWKVHLLVLSIWNGLLLPFAGLFTGISWYLSLIYLIFLSGRGRRLGLRGIVILMLSLACIMGSYTATYWVDHDVSHGIFVASLWLHYLVLWGENYLFSLGHLKQQLHERHQMLRLFSTQMWQSKETFHNFLESSPEIQLVLTKEFNITHVNAAVRSLLGYKVADLLDKPLFTLIAWDEHSLRDRQLFFEKLDQFSQKQQMMTFMETFRTIRGFSKEMALSLSPSKNHHSSEIFARISEVPYDLLGTCLHKEVTCFRIPNSFYHVDILSYRLVHALRAYLSQKEVQRIRLALREVLINAMEHGNCNIHFTQKTHLLKSNQYERFLKEQQQKYRHRLITAHTSFSSSQVTYRIIDQGEGFNVSYLHHALLHSHAPRQHGRGMTMVKQVFDTVQYNAKGNAVVLIKRYR